jgi:outer membrane protein OmpA-like peptidoglycan-associated protein/tetratricopeptide (TPR) repeat protein
MSNKLLFNILFALILFVNIFCGSENIQAQEIIQNKKKLQKLANEYFDNEEFNKALPLLLKLDSLIPDNFEIKYDIGACYLNTPYEKTKGIPFLEFALEKGGSLLPNAVFYDLGTLYHINYQFDEAITQFKRFIEIAEKDNYLIVTANRMITVCKNAKEILENPLLTEIINIGEPVNSENSEINPLISADEGIIYYTRSFSKSFGELDIEFLKKIYYSELKNKQWQEPIEIQIENPLGVMQVSLVGTSPDGEHLFFSIGNDVSSDLYFCRIIDNKCNNFTKMSEIINSPFWEGKVSITPDGNCLYFSSNRPGGFGGKDIYKVVKDENGNWSNLQNLGSSVNTEFDEDAPFIHPDNKTLYYSSNGHNTIGGFDVFNSILIDSINNWSEPTNLGFPINTTSDDIGFVISADGNSAYLSSAQNNSSGKYDIYKVVLHKTIPLTLIKGIIKGGEPPIPINARIKIIDHETKERLKYIYNPSPKTGKYLLIFPPNKNYDMLIEADGFYPQLVNIFVPNQTYFYELFQEIHLKKIKVNDSDSIIGQEITITNTFYDIYKTKVGDSLLVESESNRIHKFDDLLKVVEDIINSTDSLGLKKLDSLSAKINDSENQIKNKNNKDYNKLLNLIENSIESTDSISLLLLDANTAYNDVTNCTYFFGLNKSDSTLNRVIIDNDTLYTIPNVNTIKTKVKNTVKDEHETHIDFKLTPNNLKKYIYTNYVYFETGISDITENYNKIINGIIELLIFNQNLGIEIHGYADPEGSIETNFELSKSRAFNVMEYIVSRQIDPNRIIMSAHGEVGKENVIDNAKMQHLRRVEIIVFEVQSLPKNN